MASCLFADSLKQSNLSGSPMGIRLGASSDQNSMQAYANHFRQKNGLEVQVKSSRNGGWILTCLTDSMTKVLT